MPNFLSEGVSTITYELLFPSFIRPWASPIFWGLALYLLGRGVWAWAIADTIHYCGIKCSGLFSCCASFGSEWTQSFCSQPATNGLYSVSLEDRHCCDGFLGRRAAYGKQSNTKSSEFMGCELGKELRRI